ncbi:FecR family protein, partial [Rhizobium halophilum]|uniref:FecR family protein n=1 Tax=Rhizobium halophilum TaxID=2846852 RepID=UPI001EFCB6A5
MSPILCLLRLSVFLLATLSASLAFAQEWVVSRTTKQVSYTTDKKTWDDVKVGITIPSNAWVATGPRGRVTLTRGPESLSLSPNTLGAVITTQGLFSRKTEVVQQTGQIALDIEKRSRPHTYVHTPFLAAVVKGTSFTVTVTDEDASVSVQEGLVQVSSFTSGQSANVGPGQQVTVDQAQNMSVAGVAEPPAVFSVEPTPASVPAVGKANPIGAGPSAGGQNSAATGNAGGAASSSNSSGDSSSSGPVNSKAERDGKGNAKADGKSNAGGNGKDNAGGKGKDNAGGKGKDNAGGKGKDNAGGKGKDNAGGKGKDNAGGKGKDNAGGKGKDNAGGKG